MFVLPVRCTKKVCNVGAVIRKFELVDFVEQLQHDGTARCHNVGQGT